MSFSFRVQAATIIAAAAAAAAEMAKVVEQQPAHKVDEAAVNAAVSAHAGLLTVPDGKEVAISVAGYVSYSQNGETPEISTASINITAGVTAPATA